MIIHLLCNDGSPIGVTPNYIEGRGVGGAELAMMRLMETFAQRGHSVTVYNDPQPPGDYAGVIYSPISAYDNRTPRDVLIIFRSPNDRYNPVHMPPEVRKIWWSTDQYTVGDFRALAAMVDYVVTISPYHTNYHRRRYEIPMRKMGHIDIGIKVEEYHRPEITKIPNRMIFCSIPDRGLTILHAAWPLIKREVKDARLFITGDYTLWGSASAGNQHHRLMWASHDDIDFLGKVPRSRLVELQLQSMIMSYPCIYEELFCISAAECQVAGAYPVTSGYGALPTTNEFGSVIVGDPKSPAFVEKFAGRITSLLVNEIKYLEQRQSIMRNAAQNRFSLDVVAERWEELFENGRLS